MHNPYQRYVGKQFIVQEDVDTGAGFVEKGIVYYYLGLLQGATGDIFHIFCHEYFANPADAHLKVATETLRYTVPYWGDDKQIAETLIYGQNAWSKNPYMFMVGINDKESSKQVDEQSNKLLFGNFLLVENNNL